MNILDKYPLLDDYILKKTGVTSDYKVEWDWIRFMIRGKMFACFCQNGGDNPLITVKGLPTNNLYLRNEFAPHIKEGYYMNKVHWNSVEVSGNVDIEVIKNMIDEGYELVFKSFPKKIQAEILSEA